MRQRDRAKVAGKVQIDVFHGHYLRHAAAGGSALHAKHRPQRGLAQANQAFLANFAQGVTQSHGGGGFALTRRRRRNSGHQNELAANFVWHACNMF